MSSLHKLTLGLQILQWMVICVDNGFLSHCIVLPLLKKLNTGIQFLIICRVVQNSPMKHIKMIAYWLTSFHQDCSHNISADIHLQFKGILQVRQCKDWCLVDLLFHLIEKFPLILSALETLTIGCYGMEWHNCHWEGDTNFSRYCPAPTKLLTSVTLVAIDDLMMASIFIGSILSSPPPITYPKTPITLEQTHIYWGFASYWCFFRVS